MPVELYNVIFTGELVDQAAPDNARRKLAALFRLDADQVDHLFSGRPIVVKRDVDLDTASRLQDVFRKAGGRALIEPVDVVSAAPTPDLPATSTAEAAPIELTLAPVGAPLEQIDDQAPPRSPDTTALSLVTEQDWTLADCGPPAALQPDFDLDYLELVPMVAPTAGSTTQRDAASAPPDRTPSS